VDAQALIAREQTATEAVSPAMLAVTNLRHLTPGQRTWAVSPLMPFLTGYSADGETHGATGGRSMPQGLALQCPYLGQPGNRRSPQDKCGQDCENCP
jgi:hypothetical protein